MSAGSGKQARLFVLLAAITMLAACSLSGQRRPERVNADVPASVADDGSPAEPLPPVAVPESAAAAFARALAAMADEDWLSARLELERLARDYPSLPGPYVNLAIVHRREGNDADAESALEAALGIAPGHASANNELGMLLREQGKFDAAEEAYRRAIAGDPDFALAHYNLGVLLDLYRQREGEALEEYEAYQALASEPDETVARWIVDLRRRLGLPERPPQMAQGDGS